MALSDWLRIYITGDGLTSCREHVIRSLYAEMLEDYQREMEEFEWRTK